MYYTIIKNDLGQYIAHAFDANGFSWYGRPFPTIALADQSARRYLGEQAVRSN